MKCPKCDYLNPENAKFCANCGAALERENKEEQKEIPGKENKGREMMDRVVKQVKVLLSNKAVLASAIGVVLLLGVVGNVLFAKPTIDLNKYISVKTDGYDTFGFAGIATDYIKFAADNEDKLELNEENYAAVSRYEMYMDEVEFFFSFVEIAGDKNNNLSNGDTVVFSIKCDEEAIEEYLGCKVKYKDITYKVTDLEELQEINPFDYIEMTAVGTDPYGTVIFDSNGKDDELFDNLELSDSRIDGVKNGDIIRLTAELPDWYAEAWGIKTSVTEKEYMVEGLDYYVKSATDISATAMAEMQKQAEDTLRAQLAKDDEDLKQINEVTYLGNYFLSPKEGIEETNRIYLVYRINGILDYSYHFYDGIGKVRREVELYRYVAFNTLINTEKEETKVDIMDYSTTGTSFSLNLKLSNGRKENFKFKGFTSLDDMFNAVVTRQLEDYNFEDNVSNKKTEESTTTEPSEAMTKEEGSLENASDAESDYIFPESNSKYLKNEDLSGLSKEELKLARNEIYARHGRIFEDETLKAYFEAKDWYEPHVSGDDFSEDQLSQLEKDNIKLIQEAESNL